MARPARFDADYYRRFYDDPTTRVAGPQDTARLGRFVAGYLAFLGARVRSVLDLGCGRGFWRPVCRRHFPQASYRGVEFSDYLCQAHGWEHGSVVDYAPGRTFDLVVCQGVMQYLTDRNAARAIANLGRLTGTALYLEALTKADVRGNADLSVTDTDVHLRSGEWYRHRLRRSFTNLGGGLFLARRSGLTTFELESLP